MATSSRPSRSTIAGGVPAGANTPYQSERSIGTPSSLNVGTSGSARERSAPEAATMRSLPLR